ncbi:MAG: hypothetical protein E7052_06090 [Lentisphaerae bacterium]|nr:hypothetical protein [Lentisphaerota bacterium]
MKIQNKFLLGAASLALMGMLSGCVSFSDCAAMPGDADTDKGNMPFVAQARKDYEARKQFKRKVVIKMSEKGYRFLTVDPRRRGSSRIFLTDGLRRDLMATADSTLTNIVSTMQDFELVNSESSLRTTPGATITRVPAAPQAPSGPYLLTFNINDVEMSDANDAIRGVTNIADIAMSASGASRNSRRAVQRANEIHWYYANVSLEVTLTAPNGKNVFNFAETVVYPEMLPGNRPSESTLKQAVAHAVREAMKQYVIAFGPPLYVDQTVGDGLFARLSAGSEYGISKGQRVRFFRWVSRQVPTLPGEPEKYEASKQIIREGVVGYCGAPVDRDHAWVYVDGNNEPGKKSVFTWTSAEIVK